MFISKINADGMDRSPWGSFWFESISSFGANGIRVTADTSMQLSAVFRAVSLLAGHMASFPIKFYEAGSVTEIKKHPLLTLLNRRPNQWQNSFEWREMLSGHIDLRGNAYNEITLTPNGDIAALTPIHPDRIKPEYIGEGPNYRYRIVQRDGAVRYLPRELVWHIRGISSNGIMGLSVIEHAAESMGVGLAAQAYGNRFFANDAKPGGGWIEFPGKFADAEARTVFRDTWMQAQGGANKGKTAVLENGMKFHELGLKNSDAQFLETRKFQVSEIARWFGVPPHKLGDLDKATFTNIEQQALEYLQDGLLPRATRWEASILAELLLESEEIDVRYDFRSLLRGDSAQRAAYFTSGINGGWLTRNEARHTEGLSPLPGLDEPLRPLNMVEEGAADQTTAPAKPTAPVPVKPNPGKPAEDAASRVKRMIMANADRLARRVAGGKMPPAEIIAEGIGITTEAATAWIVANSDTTKDEHAISASLVALGIGA